MEYYKEVDVTNWRGIIAVFLFLILLLGAFMIPRYTAIEGYDYTTVKVSTPNEIELNNNTTNVSGDFTLENGIAYSTHYASAGYINVNESLNTSEGSTFNFTLMRIGTFTSFEIILYNETYRIQVLDIKVTTDSYGQSTVLNVNVNGYNCESRDIDLEKFNKNPVISLFKFNDSYMFSFGYLNYNISRETLEHGVGVGTANATSIYLSGNFFYYYGLNGISKEKVEITEHHYPLVRNWWYIALVILVSVIGFLGVYLYRGRYIELILLTLLGVVYLIDTGINMTLITSYLVNTTVILLGLTFTVMGVDIKQYEAIDQFLEKHMWKFTVVWAIILTIYFLL